MMLLLAAALMRMGDTLTERPYRQRLPELHRLVSVNMVTPCAVVLVGLESEERVEATIER